MDMDGILIAYANALNEICSTLRAVIKMVDASTHCSNLLFYCAPPCVCVCERECMHSRAMCLCCNLCNFAKIYLNPAYSTNIHPPIENNHCLHKFNVRKLLIAFWNYSADEWTHRKRSAAAGQGKECEISAMETESTGASKWGEECLQRK